MTDEEKMDKIDAVLGYMDDKDLVNVWNRYANEVGEDEIHPMDDVAKVFEGYSIEELIDLGTNGFSLLDNWFMGDTSFDYPDYYIDFDDIERYCVDNDDDLGNSEIWKVLKGEE